MQVRVGVPWQSRGGGLRAGIAGKLQIRTKGMSTHGTESQSLGQLTQVCGTCTMGLKRAQQMSGLGLEPRR